MMNCNQHFRNVNRQGSWCFLPRSIGRPAVLLFDHGDQDLQEQSSDGGITADQTINYIPKRSSCVAVHRNDEPQECRAYPEGHHQPPPCAPGPHRSAEGAAGQPRGQVPVQGRRHAQVRRLDHGLPTQIRPAVLGVEGRVDRLHLPQRHHPGVQLPEVQHGRRVHPGQHHHGRRLPDQGPALRGRLQPALDAAQRPHPRQDVLRRGDARPIHHEPLRRRQLVRARGLRPLRRFLRRPPGPAPHHDRLRLRGPPAAQGLPHDGLHRDPLRRGEEAHRHGAPRADPGLPQLRGRHERLGADWARCRPEAGYVQVAYA